MRSSRSVLPKLKTALRSSVSLRRSSLKQQKLSWGLKHEHQDWFDENDVHITQLLHEKNQAYVKWQNDPNFKSKADKFRHLRREAQMRLHEMKDHWWYRKADEVKKYADSNNSKQFFGALKTVKQALTIWTHPFTIS